MSDSDKRPRTFPLRLAASLRDRASLLADRDGVSLNHFINIAVAEKVSRLDRVALREHDEIGKQLKQTLAVEVLTKRLDK
jgi:hypothetical protein